LVVSSGLFERLLFILKPRGTFSRHLKIIENVRSLLKSVNSLRPGKHFRYGLSHEISRDRSQVTPKGLAFAALMIPKSIAAATLFSRPAFNRVITFFASEGLIPLIGALRWPDRSVGFGRMNKMLSEKKENSNESVLGIVANICGPDGRAHDCWSAVFMGSDAGERTAAQ
jgi:hypothetical protein